MVLAELLGDLSVSSFLETYYHKLPLARPGGCRSLVAALDWQRIEQLLAQPDVDVLVGREGQRKPGDPPTTMAQVRNALEEGYTLGIRRAEKHDAMLSDLAQAFHREFLAPVDLHIYCTPAGQPGFGWHYDAEDVFLLQVKGSKEWRLRKNTVNPWPLVETIPADMRFQREIMPIMQCRLEAGDWLYVPAGYWHCSQAGEESISLSIGIRSVTAVDAYDFVRTFLLTSLRWRQRLPVAGQANSISENDLIQRYQVILTELGQDLLSLFRDEATVRSFLLSLGRPMSG